MEASPFPSPLSPPPPTLVSAGGSSLALSWTGGGHGSVEVEFRQQGWLRYGAWTQHRVPPEECSADGGGTTTLRDLTPQSTYEIRLVLDAGDVRQRSDVVAFQTSLLAPPLTDYSRRPLVANLSFLFTIDEKLSLNSLAMAPPCMKCTRHDRLLLHWVGPAAQSGDVVAYRVRCFKGANRWPNKHECEAKLASRLLRPSEQTAQFLQGLVAMRVPPGQGLTGRGRTNSQASGDDDSSTGNAQETVSDEGSEVHFWLLNLQSSQMYQVQVAAVTAGGVGEWSPKSDPLYTWRAAPAVKTPQQLFRTHASIVIGLALEPLEDGSKGQDEEVDQFEITMQPDAKGEERLVATVPYDMARELAASLRAFLAAGASPASPVHEADVPQCVAVINGLSPLRRYACTVRAMTIAGTGGPSPPLEAATAAISPEVSEVSVEVGDHRTATVSWCVTPASMPDELVTFFFAEDAPEMLQMRRLRGFRVQLADAPRPGTRWRDIRGVRAVDAGSTAAIGRRYSVVLRDLAPNSVSLVSIAAVPHAEGESTWSKPAEVVTEDLAPLLDAPVELQRTSRCGARVQWATPRAISGVPVLSYVLYVSRRSERGRVVGGISELELPLHTGPGAVEETNEARVWLDGDVTRASLGLLEPGTTYVLQVASKTARGTGNRSADCVVVTRQCAPGMSSVGPRLVKAYYNQLLLVCDGPIADWGEGEQSDVIGYRARYYACSRFGGPHGAWSPCGSVEYTVVGGPAVQFCLGDLLPERTYVLQVAAVTSAGQGPWSGQSQRLSTWHVAPNLLAPRLLFRTHTVFVLGWEQEPRCTGDADVHDEEIQAFVVRTSTATTTRTDTQSTRVTCCKARELAEAWRNGGAGATAAGSLARSISDEARWPLTMLCEDPDLYCPVYVAVVHNLSPDCTYTATVCSVAAAGEGHVSSSSAEMVTLAVAPTVDELQVEEVQHDQIQVSWQLSCLEPMLSCAASEQLGLAASVEELDVRGYAVRCAPWNSWTRFGWRNPVYTEVGALSFSDTDAGRVHFAVADLDPEQRYIVEVRAHSSRGAGQWCRASDQPTCTAIVAQPPAAPELVYATPHALHFSFAGVADSRVSSYEVRRYEGWSGGWGWPSKPLKFNSDLPAVRVLHDSSKPTSEQRWVVTLDRLRSETAYSLQLRGVTQSGSITKWSARSEAMVTLPGNGEVEPEIGVGVNDDGEREANAVAMGGGPPGASPVAVDKKEESIDDFSKKLEAVLSITMDYATSGVPLSSVRIPSVAEQADQLLKAHHGSRTAAILAVAKVEDETSWRTKLPDFLIQQVPVVGCSTLLLRELWKNIRQCALIAHLYGHDTRAAETQALILSCLMPTGGGASDVAASSSQDDIAMSSRRIAVLVSRALARETLVLATGLKSAGQVVGLLEVAGRLLKEAHGSGEPSMVRRNGRSEDRDGGSSGSAAGGDPAAAGSGDTAAGTPQRELPDEAAQPSPARVALTLFRPNSVEERPEVVLGFVAIWLLPLFVSVTRFGADRLMPLMSKRIQMPLAILVVLLIAMMVMAHMSAAWIQRNFEHIWVLSSTLIFILYAMIPGTSAWLATRSILKGTEDPPFFTILGVYNLATASLRWIRDIDNDALLETHPAPVYLLRARDHIEVVIKYLWRALLIDFVLEELLGRALGLHPLRVLGPPLSESHRTLTEYRTLSFAMGLLAAWAQSRVLELLQRRNVLLRLLGARKAIFSGLSLLLMGAWNAMIQQAKTQSFLRRAMGFLRDVSPTPWWCCLVLWIRKYGAVAGVVVPILLHILRHPRYHGLSVDSIIKLTLTIGVVLGYVLCQTFTTLWAEKKEDLQQDYRVLYLFPHMSSQARSKASVAMRLAKKKGAEGVCDTAVEWMATRVARRTSTFALKFLFGRTASVPMT